MKNQKTNFLVPQCLSALVPAFTLAEVLITLAIIGVVAAMTIPTLIADYQKKVYINKLKTTYTTLTHGMQLLMAETGCFDDIECTGAFDGIYSDVTDAEWNKTFFSKMEKVFKIAEKCDNTGNSCKLLGDKYKKLGDGDYIDYTTENRVGFTLQNGAWIFFNNAKHEFPSANNSAIKKVVSYMVVDTNGSQGPNQAGRDLFQMILAQNGRIYADTSIEMEKAKLGDEWETSTDYWRNAPIQCGQLDGTIPTNAYGTNCLARIMEENWQMNY